MHRPAVMQGLCTHFNSVQFDLMLVIYKYTIVAVDHKMCFIYAVTETETEAECQIDEC